MSNDKSGVTPPKLAVVDSDFWHCVSQRLGAVVGPIADMKDQEILNSKAFKVMCVELEFRLQYLAELITELQGDARAADGLISELQSDTRTLDFKIQEISDPSDKIPI